MSKPLPALPASADERIAGLRRAAPVIYDFLLAHSLQWGSMTLAWGRGPSDHASAQFPSQFNEDHGLVFSQRTDGTLHPDTRTWTGEAAELLVARVSVPKPRTTHKSVAARFNERLRSSRVTVLKRIIHPGDVNRVRALPALRHIVVTHTENRTVFLWDTDRQPHRAPADSPKSSQPDLELVGHEADCSINALDTSGASLVLSGGVDAIVCGWDVRDDSANKQQSGGLQPRFVLRGHTGPVEDCCFHPGDATLCCSVSRDRSLITWDTRIAGPALKLADAHSDDANTVAWSALDATKIITGGSDRFVHVFDARKLDVPQASVKLGASVTNVSWSPHTRDTFAVSDEDATVRVFRCSGGGGGGGANLDLLFTHLGHRASANDLAWHPTAPWVLASVSDDSSKAGGGMLQIYRVSEFVEKDPVLDADWSAGLNAMLGSRSRANSVQSGASDDE